MNTFAVLFDMDGLMLDTERMARAAWTRALAEHGYQLDDRSYLNIVGRTVRDAESVLIDLFGVDLPFKKVFEQRQAFYEADIETNGIPVKAGLIDLLDFLEANHITKAVASSTPRWFALHKLERVGIRTRFDVLVCGDEVPHGKPAPDLFVEAARQIGYPARLCVALEDSEAGIMAAHQAGALPIMIPDLKPATPEIAGLAYGVYSSLSEVIPVLDGFLTEGLPVL